jgi:hypothetical protein
MKIDKVVDMMEANSRCMREFAEFLKEAKPRQLNALRRMLKLFNRPRPGDWCDDLEPYAIQGAVESMAVSLVPGDQADAEFKKRARHLGEAMSCSAYNLYAEKAPKRDFDQLIDFLEHLGQSFGSPTDIMRKQIAVEDKNAPIAEEPATPNSKPGVITQAEIADLFRREYAMRDTFLAIHSRIDDGAIIEAGRYSAMVDNEESSYVCGFGNGGVYVRDDGDPSESLANLSASLDAANYADLTAMVERWERLGGRDSASQLVVLDATDDDDLKLTKPEFLAAIAAIKNVRASARRGGRESDDEEVVTETALLGRKFYKFKEACSEAPRVTVQLWDRTEGISDDSIDLNEDEFAKVLATVREMRGEHSGPTAVAA